MEINRIRGVKKTLTKKSALTLKDRVPLRTLSPNVLTDRPTIIKGRKILRPNAERGNFVAIPEEQTVPLVEKTADVCQSLDYRFCTEEEPPTEYWKILAEKRAVALKNALNENYELYEENTSLKNQVLQLESELVYFQLVHSLQK